MRILEKTSELTLCSQMSGIFNRHGMWWPLHSDTQPIWFGLTQKQETRGSCSQRVRDQRRLVYYVLPGITHTRQLVGREWLVANTWLLDVSDISALSPPHRVAGDHHLTLDLDRDPKMNHNERRVVITSDPVESKAINATEAEYAFEWSPLGRQFHHFAELWKYASLLRSASVCAALPADCNRP